MIVLIHGAAKMAKINKYSRNERKKVIDNVDEKKKKLCPLKHLQNLIRVCFSKTTY